MVVINFSHPLTVAQVDCIEALTGQKVERVIEARAQFDDGQSRGTGRISAAPWTPQRGGREWV